MYKFNLGKKEMNSNIVCLGEQLEEILTSIYKVNSKLRWYMYDVKGSAREETYLLSRQEQIIINDTITLIELVRNVIQFERGVFIGTIKPICDNEYASDTLPYTEEEEKMQFAHAEVEIRTFDYSYFEIYCKSELMKNIIQEDVRHRYTVSKSREEKLSIEINKDVMLLR